MSCHRESWGPSRSQLRERLSSRHSEVAKSPTHKEAKDDELRKLYRQMSIESRPADSPNSCCPCLPQVLGSPYFDYAIAVVICFNAVVTGAEVDYDAVHGGQHPFFTYAEYACISVFTLEILLRLLAFGRKFFVKTGCTWACLDIFFVVMAYIDIVLSVAMEDMFKGNNSGMSFGQTAGKVLKIVRMMRVMRVIRMLRFFGELRVMLQMVFNSLFSLFWLLTFLAVLLYAFAILLTKGVTDYLRPGVHAVPPDLDMVEDLEEKYGSLFLTMYSLFQGMTGGISWGEIATPIYDVGVVYFLLILVFLCFTIFSVLNIVTGVFVDGAIELAKRDRSILIEKEKLARQAVASHLLELLEAIDQDGSGTISAEELQQALQDEEIVVFLGAMQVDCDDAKDLLYLLDRDGDGTVDVVEFVDGMQSLKGEAKSADVHRLSCDIRAIAHHLCKLSGDSTGRLSLVGRRSSNSAPPAPRNSVESVAETEEEANEDREEVPEQPQMDLGKAAEGEDSPSQVESPVPTIVGSSCGGHPEAKVIDGNFSKLSL